MSKATAKDRISSLPDSLLHHILSFLYINEGARTSVLSKRWKYIWTTVPILDFQMQSLDLDPSSAKTQKFMDFVDGTLHLHRLSDVHKFALSWAGHLNQSRLHSWISNVISANVKVFSLNLLKNQPLFIPLSLFTCESLISLELGSCRFTLPRYISFPRLKRLKLMGFEFSDECWNEKLFSNSPVLEELTLEHSRFRMRNFCILIPTLKLLKIDTGFFKVNELWDCVIKIDAPELVTFSYKGYVAKEFALSSFQALVEASIFFNTEDHVGAEAICQLLGALAHVKCLSVCDETLQAICSEDYLSNNLLTFQNVKMLKISDSITTDQGLTALLKAVPNLESLVFVNYMIDVEEDSDEEDESESDEDDSDIAEGDRDDDSDSVEGANNDKNEDDGDGDDDSEDHDANSIEGANYHNNEDEGDVADADECEDNYDSENERWALDIVTNGCLLPHLKSVCFQQFVGNPREMKWARLILRDAEALQKMTIHHYNKSYLRHVNAKTENEYMAEIPSFPRASTGCVIRFSSQD